MSLPPIPKRKGMIPHSAQWDGQQWRNVLYRSAQAAKLEAAGPDQREREQGDLFND